MAKNVYTEDQILIGDLKGVKEQVMLLPGKEHSGQKEQHVQGPRGGNRPGRVQGWLWFAFSLSEVRRCWRVLSRGVTRSDMISQDFLSYCVDNLHFYTTSQFLKCFHTYLLIPLMKALKLREVKTAFLKPYR